MTTYWESKNLKRFITYGEEKRCMCGRLAVEVEAMKDGKMLLNDKGFPAFFCEKHKVGNGTLVKYKLPTRFRLVS